jgi:glycosyltransferase involved in cell wall biosynthesis
MKSIAIIANSTHGGGAEISMLTLHRQFIDRKFQSTFVAINDMEDDLEVADKDLLFIKRSWNDGMKRTYLSFRKFKSELISLSPEVIIVNCELPELFVAFTNLKGIKLIVVEHTSKPWKGRRFLGLIVRSILKMKGAIWVTVSFNMLEIWPLRARATYIPNSLQLIRKSNSITSPSEVVFVGRLRREKCPELVIDACIESGIAVVLFGEGNLSNQLRSIYASEHQVRFVGYQQNPWSSISAESLVVVASEYEGDGLVVLEAIQNGNPVLLRDNADLRRFALDDRNYFTDQAELVDKISQFSRNSYDFKVAKEMRDTILKPRDLSTVTKKWIDFVQEI